MLLNQLYNAEHHSKNLNEVDFLYRQVDGGNGVCSNMVMGLKIEVLYANFGFLANPQPRVMTLLFCTGMEKGRAPTL